MRESILHLIMITMVIQTHVFVKTHIAAFQTNEPLYIFQIFNVSLTNSVYAHAIARVEVSAQLEESVLLILRTGLPKSWRKYIYLLGTWPSF